MHDDHWFFRESIRSFASVGPIIVFVSRYAWNGTQGDWNQCAELAAQEGATVILGDWTDEAQQRSDALATLRSAGHGFVFIPDTDEVISPELLESLRRLADADAADTVRVHMDTYWKSAEYVIRPRERLTPILLLHCQRVEHEYIREYVGGRSLVLGPEHGILHHLSYAGPDQRIVRKITTWGHRNELVPDWFDNVWRRWDQDKLLRNLHPTHPQAYGFAERIHVPNVLSDIRVDPSRQVVSSVNPWPKVSVVIPVYGGKEDVQLCLHSLGLITDLLHEVIVVDDKSPDDTPEAIANYDFVHLIRSEQNFGFSKSCNIGFKESTGELVLFLNSDTVLPRAGLIRLVESIMGPQASAVGPLTNNSGYHQPTTVTFTSLVNLELFAEDFANRAIDDLEVDMLVGFCLLIKRSALDEVGAFDERFGRGMFEDNDLCYRLRRAGHRLLVSQRSFVYHAGSKTLRRLDEHPSALLERNRPIYRSKWSQDLHSGFASHLSGDAPHPIRFDHSLKPELVALATAERARAADISLCMIVRNEERVLANCLQSAKPYFSQIIVVDTGSTDQTPNIAKELGAELFEFPWTESFAEARNQSLAHARGSWIFWLDADDTLPPGAGEDLLEAALTASPDIMAFVVPVQFVEEGPGAGTRVDHVKLFRNIPGIHFEGRIHEQILPSIRSLGGQVARSNAVVLHSGYDTSEAGQLKKKERDYRLLELDLLERPGHPFVLFNLGMTDYYTGKHLSAIDWLQQCLHASAEGDSHVRKVYSLMASAHKSLHQPQECLDVLNQGLSSFPDDPELHFQAGMVLTDLGRYEEARDHYLSIHQGTGEHFSSFDIGILGHKRWHNLAVVQLHLGDYKAARGSWKMALQDQLFIPSALDLFAAALEKEDFATAQWTRDLVRRRQGSSELWATLSFKYAQALGGIAEGELALRRCVESEYLSIGPRLVLARQLLSDFREEEAREHLQILEDLGCAEAAFYLGVSATRNGRYEEAINWMERAHRLDPHHDETVVQIENLRRALDDSNMTLI